MVEGIIGGMINNKINRNERGREGVVIHIPEREKKKSGHANTALIDLEHEARFLQVVR